MKQKVDAQLEILVASLDAHPLELVTEKIGSRVTVAGVRQTSRRCRTAKGEPMMFLTWENLNGTLDVILFPDVYRAVKSFVNSNIPLLITGVMEMDAGGEEPFLRAEKVVSER